MVSRTPYGIDILVGASVFKNLGTPSCPSEVGSIFSLLLVAYIKVIKMINAVVIPIQNFEDQVWLA